MFSRRFPLRARPGRLARVVLVAGTLGLLALPALAKDGPKPSPAPARPVARLISAPRTEVPARLKARLAARVAALPVSYAPAASPFAAAAATNDERRAFELINAERARRGLRPLVLDGALVRMARYHSQNMARQNFFNHVDRDGLDLQGRAQVLGLRGWRALGENIAYNQGYPDPSAFAVERWMISEKHRENILNGEYTHAGLGVARGADGRVYFTQVFMRR